MLVSLLKTLQNSLLLVFAKSPGSSVNLLCNFLASDSAAFRLSSKFGGN